MPAPEIELQFTKNEADRSQGLNCGDIGRYCYMAREGAQNSTDAGDKMLDADRELPVKDALSDMRTRFESPESNESDSFKL
jgi:hypothetical protein